MIILCDGMDRCGKSTLIDGLRSVIRDPNISVCHEGKPPKNVDPFEWSKVHYKHYFELLEDFDLLGRSLISDRSHLGETVYGPLFRHYDASYIWELEERFSKHVENGCCLIMLTDDPEKIISRDDGKSLEKNLDDVTCVREKFIDSFSKSKITHRLHIDISSVGGFNNVLPIAMEFIYGQCK